MPHVTKKCFPTKCRKCSARVLYWESTKGAKVFLNLPIYGKPIRHICKKPVIKKKFVIETHLDHLKKRQEKSITYQCPVCNKIFQKEHHLDQHIAKLKKIDDPHAMFFEQILDLLVPIGNDQGEKQHSLHDSFQTPRDNHYMNDRFILKTKDPKTKKKFEKLYRG